MAGVPGDSLITDVTHDATHVSPMSRLMTVGWRGRIRTFDLLIQSQAPYRLATRQRAGRDDTPDGPADPTVGSRPDRNSTADRAYGSLDGNPGGSRPLRRVSSRTIGRARVRLGGSDKWTSSDHKRGWGRICQWAGQNGRRRGTEEPGPGRRRPPGAPSASLPTVTTPPPGTRSSTPSALRSRYLPVVLDLIVPGLGHLVAGRRKLAAIFGIPFLALVLVAPGDRRDDVRRPPRRRGGQRVLAAARRPGRRPGLAPARRGREPAGAGPAPAARPRRGPGRRPARAVRGAAGRPRLHHERGPGPDRRSSSSAMPAPGAGRLRARSRRIRATSRRRRHPRRRRPCRRSRRPPVPSGSTSC